jgi:hypothetical protein
MQLFEQGRHRNATAALEIGGELANPPVDCLERDRDRDRVGRFGDALGVVAAGGLDRQPDRLPGDASLLITNASE